MTTETRDSVASMETAGRIIEPGSPGYVPVSYRDNSLFSGEALIRLLQQEIIIWKRTNTL